MLACGSIASRAVGYGMPGQSVDGNDLLAVQAAVQGAVQRARSGEGPTLIEACTYRLGGHWAADPEGYRPEAERESWRARDPIPRLEAHLCQAGDLDREAVEGLWEWARAEVGRATAEAEAARLAGPEDLGYDQVLAR